jgi:hypothetical protein
MNPEIFHHARKEAKQIHHESKNILPDHNLVFHETTIGFEIAQFYSDWVPYLTNSIAFGAHKLTLKQVKTIIDDNEHLQFL